MNNLFDVIFWAVYLIVIGFSVALLFLRERRRKYKQKGFPISSLLIMTVFEMIAIILLFPPLLTTIITFGLFTYIFFIFLFPFVLNLVMLTLVYEEKMIGILIELTMAFKKLPAKIKSTWQFLSDRVTKN